MKLAQKTILGLVLIFIFALGASSCQDIDVITYKVVKSAALAVDTGMKTYAENYCPTDCPFPVSMETHNRIKVAYQNYQVYGKAVVAVAKTYTSLKDSGVSKEVLLEKEKEVVASLTKFSEEYEVLRTSLTTVGVKNVTPFNKLEK